MSERPKSIDLQPGTTLRWMGTSGSDNIVLDRRKRYDDDHHGLPYKPGWWIVNGGGLVDTAIDEEGSKWEIVDVKPRPATELLIDLVHTLGGELDLKRNDAGEWWVDDWQRDIALPAEQLVLLNVLMPDGRPRS